jgi:hypothetical protein
MPAFAPTDSDREIWDVVAFFWQLPGMSASEYRSPIEGPREEQPERDHSP